MLDKLRFTVDTVAQITDAVANRGADGSHLQHIASERAQALKETGTGGRGPVDGFRYMESIPNDFMHTPHDAEALERARNVASFLATLGADAVHELERQLPSAVGHALDIAEVVSDLACLARVRNATAEDNAADIAAAREELQGWNMTHALAKANGRFTPAVRRYIVEELLPQAKNDGTSLEAVTQALLTNPALNTRDVQVALLAHIEQARPTGPVTGLYPHAAPPASALAAVRILAATAASATGLSIDMPEMRLRSIGGNAALPNVKWDTLALLTLVAAGNDGAVDGGKLAGAVRLATHLSADVAKQVLAKVTPAQTNVHLQRALVGMSLDFAERNTGSATVSEVRRQAMQLLEQQRGNDERPFAPEVLGALWQRIATDPHEDAVMDAIRIAGHLTGVYDQHEDAAQRASLRLALYTGHRAEADMPWMLRCLLRDAHFTAMSSVRTVASALNGGSFTPKAPPAPVESFHYNGLWSDAGSVAVKSNAVKDLVPAHPRRGFWCTGDVVTAALDRLEHEPQHDELTQLLLVYGLADQGAGIAARCQKLLERSSGQCSAGVLSAIYVQSLGLASERHGQGVSTWANDFLTRQGFVPAHTPGEATRDDVNSFWCGYLDAERTFSRLREKPLSLTARRELSRSLCDYSAAAPTSAAERDKLDVKRQRAIELLTTAPELNPPDVQESWRELVVFGGNPDTVGVGLDLLLNQVEKTGRLDVWLTDRLPELERTLPKWLHAKGDWFANISKLRSLLFALGDRVAAPASGLAVDAAREVIAQRHGRSRGDMQRLERSLLETARSLLAYRGSETQMIPVTGDVAQALFANDRRATGVTVGEAKHDVLAKLEIVQAQLAEGESWPAGTPAAIRETKLDPTRDIVDIGKDRYIVGYPDRRYLIEAGETREINQAATWSLLCNVPLDELRIPAR